MKKGLIVMMIVLMTMALITSCNSEAASTTDSLVEVKIAGGADSKALSVGSISNLPDISTLKWYYTATKTSGVFINGQTSGWTAVPGVETGLEGASLGQFSTGGWSFQFKGVDISTQAVIFESAVIEKVVSSETAVNGTVYLTVPLTANASGAKVTFSGLSWEKPENDQLVSGAASDFVLTITESDPSNTSIWTGFGYSDGVVTFTHEGDSDSFSYTTAGAHAYNFTVSYKGEVVAVYGYNVNVALGSDYSVTGSIEGSSNVQYSVVVNDVPVSVNDSSATVQGSATTTTFTVNQTPASVTAGTMSNTTIEFTNGNEAVINSSDSYYIAQATYGAEEAANFVITAGENSSNAVAGIDLDLYKYVDGTNDVKQEVANQSIKVTTTIAKGLENVSVTNDGSTEGITVDNYDSDSGVLIFTTTHFSKFLVTSSNVAINITQNKAYTNLTGNQGAFSENEIHAGDIVMLLKNAEITTSSHTVHYTTSSQQSKTVALYLDKSLTIDGNGYKVSTTQNIGIAIDNDYSVVNLNNLKITGPSLSALFIGEDVDHVTVNLNNCDFATGNDGYCIKTCNKSDYMKMLIKDSALAGWAALNLRSSNSEIIVKESDLSGSNKASESPWNNYATFVVDGDTCFTTNRHNPGVMGSNNKINVSDTKITAVTYSSNEQEWLSLQYGAMNNEVKVDGNSYICEVTRFTNEDNTYINSNTQAREGDDYTPNNTVIVNGIQYAPSTQE